MAGLDLASFTAPIDDEAPCGPDLDAEDDPAFAYFISTSEMLLPDRYFVEDHEGNRKPFFTDDRFKDLNLGSTIASGAKLLARTHDLRVLSLVAKMYIFDRKLGEFQTAVEAIAQLLEQFWDQVHPEASSGLRAGAIERLNELFTVVTALNNVPLLRSKRFGSVSWQSYTAAVRETGGDREDADTSSVDRILIDESKTDLVPVQAVQAIMARLAQALDRINATCAEKLASGAVDLRRLSDAVAKIRAMLDRVNPQAPVAAEGDEGDESASETGGGATRAAGPGVLFDTTEAAGRALADATRYLAGTEPSSPALLLLRQAQALVGKSFLDALESLLPEQVRRAKLSVAGLPIFDLPLRQLAEQGLRSDDTSSFGSRHDEEGSDEAASPPAPPVTSRAEALALLDRVAGHYRTIEPSSPIPMLIEKARALVGKDFMSLIRTMLPESILKGE